MTRSGKHTCYAGEELSCKTLYLAVRERDITVSFQKIEDALIEEVHDNAYMVLVVEAVSQMYATVPVVSVIRLQSGQNT